VNAVKIPMSRDKKIALVAHDNMKRDLLEWAALNRDLLTHHVVFATGTTGSLLERQLGFPIRKLQSGPLGGDQQIDSRIVSKEIDFMISSPLMDGEYDRLVPDYEQYLGHRLASVAAAESSGRAPRSAPQAG
jgi:methylglyoxal synthase